jgi:glycosyltransferase involved in cell wall biosynthesis
MVMQDHADGVARHPLRRVVTRRALAVADGVLFSTREQAVPWMDGGLIADRPPVYEVMGGATSLEPLDQDMARQMTGVTGAPAALWVGRLNANKDPLTVLSAIELASQSLPVLSLTMIFEGGDLQEAVERRVRTSPALSSRVRLIGPVPHDRLAAYYSAADLFILGSHHEGSGYALIEALGCGAVPIVTDIPTFRVITASGRLGRLGLPGDPRAAAAAIVDLGGANLAAMRAAAIAHVDRHLTWLAVARVALDVYADARRRRSREDLPPTAVRRDLAMATGNP